jgi:hypothetical protein
MAKKDMETFNSAYEMLLQRGEQAKEAVAARIEREQLPSWTDVPHMDKCGYELPPFDEKEHERYCAWEAALKTAMRRKVDAGEALNNDDIEQWVRRWFGSATYEYMVSHATGPSRRTVMCHQDGKIVNKIISTEAGQIRWELDDTRSKIRKTYNRIRGAVKGTREIQVITLEEAKAKAAAIKTECESLAKDYNAKVAEYNATKNQSDRVTLAQTLRKQKKQFASLKLRYRHAANLATPEGLAKWQQQEHDRHLKEQRISSYRIAANKKHWEEWSAPCTLTPGTIMQISGGYEATLHDFYEVVRVTPAYAFMRHLKQRDTHADTSYPSGTSTPLLGQYDT